MPRICSLASNRRSLLAELVACAAVFAGCAGGGTAYEFLGTPFRDNVGVATPTQPGGGAGDVDDDPFNSDDRTAVDPCDEPQSRKFVTLSLRSLVPADNVHYFLVLVAFVDAGANAGGAVCADDVQLYTRFGYSLIPDGSQRAFGNFCIPGPALVYFHENGQFQGAATGSGSSLASAIAPAQGSVASFDRFFSSAGAQVPVPDAIIFHNPGTGDGARLKISRNSSDPCDTQVIGGTASCEQDAFYYVDERDFIVGSTALGPGSGRRVPNEIQDTGCTLGFSDAPFHFLAPSRVTANNALDSEFLRGGRIDYAFVRSDTDPPFPQLVWRVTDASGAVVHDFDSRANIP